MTVLRKHILTEQGLVLLMEDASEDDTDQVARRFYENIGGAESSTASQSPSTAASRPTRCWARCSMARPRITPSGSHGIYNRMYGKPDLTEGWDERFLRSHLRAVISNEHRERWLSAMRSAGTEVDAPEPWFSDFMTR